jgi:MFS family permease
MGLGMALFSVAPFLGPAIGPITGGFLGEAAGWRWVEGMLAIFCGVICVIIILFSAETYAPLILRQRAATLSKATGKVYRFRADAAKAFDPVVLFKASLVRPWKFLLFEPIVLILSLYVAIIYGILYLNFAAYPIVFTQGRGWSVGITGLSFIGIMVGAIIAVLTTIFFSNPRYIKTITARGHPLPEDRLPPAIWGGVVIVIGLAGFAATDGPNVHWIAPIIFGVPFGLGMVVLFLATMGYLVDTYTVYAASVLAANSVLRSLFGAAFPLFTRAMYGKLGIHWAAALPGFLAFVCMPFPFLFYKYGAQIRAKGKYAAEAAAIFAQIMAARKAAMAGLTGDDEQDVGMTALERVRSVEEEDPLYGSPEILTLERTMSMEQELTSPQTIPLQRHLSPVSTRGV